MKQYKPSELFDSILTDIATKKAMKEFLNKYKEIKVRKILSSQGNIYPSLNSYCLNLNGRELPVPEDLKSDLRSMIYETIFDVCEKIINNTILQETENAHKENTIR